jgi:hypothetical protein
MIRCIECKKLFPSEGNCKICSDKCRKDRDNRKQNKRRKAQGGCSESQIRGTAKYYYKKYTTKRLIKKMANLIIRADVCREILKSRGIDVMEGEE